MKVGDTVYLVYDDSRQRACNVVIKSIGNKYITVDGVHKSEARYDKLTKRSVDDNRGWNCNAELFESESAYIEYKNKRSLERKLANEIIEALKRNTYGFNTLRDIKIILGI